MANNCCYFTVLFIPAILTFGLLAFSVSFDWWLDIKDDDLKLYQNQTQFDYDNYNKQNIDNGQTNIDYIYIEKLWPFIKRDGLYSRCLQYRKLYLKLSHNFLITQKISTIKSSKINYPKYIIKNKELEPQSSCEQPDHIRCYSNNECVRGKRCDSIVDCTDQTDEQFCDINDCEQLGTKQSIKLFCDSKCWKLNQVCKLEPLCLKRSDDEQLCEFKAKLKQDTPESVIISDVKDSNNKPSSETIDDAKLIDKKTSLNKIKSFKLSTDEYNKKLDCYQEYFDFKSAKTIAEDDLIYVKNLADSIQSEYNLNYHLHLIYVLSFCSAIIFSLLSILTLLFILCLSKLCLQCPFWFYGFFIVLTFLASSCGLLVYLYDFYINTIYKVQDPLKQLPLISELYRMNDKLKYLQQFGISFWTACAATGCAFLASIISFIVCCRLPSVRHGDKEYDIIDLRN